MQALIRSFLVATVLFGRVQTPLAATIHVPQGHGTLQAAIEAAEDGDTLVGAGLYTGPVNVDKSVKLVADRTAAIPAIQIDAGCTVPIGLNITADGVRTKGPIFVQGASLVGVYIDDSSHSKFDIISAENSCGTATIGLWIHEGDHLTFRGGNIFDFTDTAIRLDEVGAKARIKLKGFHGLNSTTGLVLENIAPGAERKGAGVELGVLFDGGVQTGIAFTDADGVVVKYSNLSTPPMSVIVDAQSDNNLFLKNSVSTVIDAGNGNCWKGNVGYLDTCP